MSDWKIGLTPATSEKTPTIIGPLTAYIAWKRLSKPAQSAIAAATRESILVYAHPNTLRALWRHGFITYNEQAWGVLTDAGREVAKWCVRDE